MINKLVPIDPGTTVTPQHVNAVIVRLNEVIEVLNAHPLRPGLDCPDCRGFGFINILETDGTSSTMKTTMCPKCGGLGTVNG
jgi:DnaJ-class molecular chaperone